MYEKLLALDVHKLNFDSSTQVFINFTLAFIMFGVALGIKTKNFKKILKNPRPVIKGVISQFVLLPAVTFLVVYLLRDFLSPSIALGMILVASCPGGNISNFITSISRGNVELSVSMTAIATVGAIFLTPFNFTFWGNLFAKSSDLVRPIEIPVGQVFITILILLGIPLFLGMLFSWKFPKITKKITKPIKIISIVIFFGFVIGAFSANFIIFVKYIKYVFIIVLAHNALAFLTGYLFASIFKTSRRNRRTITIETGIQNSGLALALIFNTKIFPETLDNGGMMFIAAWWGIWHIVSGLGISFFWSYVAKDRINYRRKYLLRERLLKKKVEKEY